MEVRCCEMINSVKRVELDSDVYTQSSEQGLEIEEWSVKKMLVFIQNIFV